MRGVSVDVSVIIPTFNRADKVCLAIKSVVAQTHSPREIIVIDDGSTDATVAKVSAQFPAVTLLTQRNKGVSAARNHGAATASGQWLAFLDSDDYWLKNKLAQQTLSHQNNREFKISHCEEIWLRNGKRVNPMRKHRKPTAWIYPQCLPLCCVSPSSVLMRRDLFTAIGGFDEALPACEDYDLWLRLFAQYPVHLVATPLLVKTGGHADQLSRQYWGMDRFRVRALDKILRSGVLSAEQTTMTRATLKHKCTVLINGGIKRGNTPLVAQHQALLAHHWPCGSL